MAVWMALIQQYEGNDSDNKRIILANQAIFLHPQQGLLKKNDHTLSLAKYTIGLQAAFLEVMKYRNQVVQETMVQRLIDVIQVQNNLTITLANTKVKDDKLGNCLVYVSYMATNVTKAFGVANGNKNQRRGINGRRISVVEVLRQGRGGRG